VCCDWSGDALEEEGVARTTRTEKTSDGGRTTTITTTTTHKTKGLFTIYNTIVNHYQVRREGLAGKHKLPRALRRVGAPPSLRNIKYTTIHNAPY